MFPFISNKITKWLLFSVMFAAVPVLIRAIVLLTRGDPPGLGALTVVDVFGTGDCLLFAVGISASAIGETIFGASETKHARTKMLVIGVNLLVVAAAVEWYCSIAPTAIVPLMQLAAPRALGDAYAVARVNAYGSLGVLIVSIVFGVFGVGLSEE